MKTSPSLDQRIAAAIQGSLKTSAACSDLLQELETAATTAVIAAQEAEARALDPTVLDADAPEQANAAKIRVQRLQAALSPLQRILAKLLAQEYAARWEDDFARVAKLYDAAVKRLNKYPELANEMADIFRSVEAVDRECNRLNFEAPSGEHRRLRFSTTAKHVLATVVLPAIDNGQLWPPRQSSIATTMVAAPAVFNSAYSPDWWKEAHDREEADAARMEQEAKNAEIAKNQFYASR
jgi:hypothetical protein